jgi:hypothetical protein
MEVRTVLATLLGRFWFELAPSMGKASAVRNAQQIALTLKMRDGLKLVASLHEPAKQQQQSKAGGRGDGAAADAPEGPLN